MTEPVQQLLTPTEYIQHHLQNWSTGTGPHSFNWDTFIYAGVIGLVFVAFFGLIARRATTGVPGPWQNFAEWVVELVDKQVKEVFHGRSTLVAPLAFTVFIWILLMNCMDFLPVDLLPLIAQAIGHALFGLEPHEVHQRVVATADINQTLAMSTVVTLITLYLGIRAKGFGHFTKELFTAPFHAESTGMVLVLAPINLFMQIVEYGSKLLSLALRLMGNMFAGELVFMLIALLPFYLSWLPGSVWAIFHILIVLLQAYIFMMLTTVYCSLAVESH